MDRTRSFEEEIEALEAAVRELEGGGLELEEAIGRYEEGIGIVKRCLQILRDAGGKVEILSRELAERPEFRPVEASDFGADARAGEETDPRAGPEAGGESETD